MSRISSFPPSRFFSLRAALAGIVLSLTVPAQAGTGRTEATLESVDAKNTAVTLVFIPKKNAKKTEKPFRDVFAIEEGHIYREKGGRKVHVKFAELQAGQRLRVTYRTPLGFTGYRMATEIVILSVGK